MTSRSIRASIPEDLARTLDRIADERDRSLSSLISEALQSQYGSQTPRAQEAATDSTRRQLARIEARLDALVAEKAVLKECLLVFVRIWLEHNPPIPDDIADSVAMSAEARLDHYLKFVAEGLGGGRSLAGSAFKDFEQPSGASAP
ncbi:MAG: ribbon-helix-helix protein, CopG family [Caulobacterales bacterium]|jgi:predicted transcriptional regulator